MQVQDGYAKQEDGHCKPCGDFCMQCHVRKAFHHLSVQDFLQACALSDAKSVALCRLFSLLRVFHQLHSGRPQPGRWLRRGRLSIWIRTSGLVPWPQAVRCCVLNIGLLLKFEPDLIHISDVAEAKIALEPSFDLQAVPGAALQRV